VLNATLHQRKLSTAEETDKSPETDTFAVSQSVSFYLLKKSPVVVFIEMTLSAGTNHFLMDCGGTSYPSGDGLGERG
jgi:hypothetical protein